MELRQFGTTGTFVSELCLGAMTFGREADEATSRAMIDRYVDAGGNFIDTANVYSAGESEAIVGRALAGSRRDDIVLATKFGFGAGPHRNDRGGGRRHIRMAVEASLRRLQTDRIDLYQIHIFDRETPIEETLSALDDLVRQGKVIYIGASNFAAWQLAQSLEVSRHEGLEPFVCYQPEYNLIRRDIEREHLPFCRQAGWAVIPWSPLAGGLLTGKYQVGVEPAAQTRAADTTTVGAAYTRRRINDATMAVAQTVKEIAHETGRTSAQIALNWVLHRPGITAPIIGARHLGQLDDNLAAAGWQLDPAHVERLDQASSTIG